MHRTGGLPLVAIAVAAAAAACSSGGGGGGGPVTAPATSPPPSPPPPPANAFENAEYNNGDYSKGLIRASAAYAASVPGGPVTGAGITIAVIDTGIDLTHAEFAGGKLAGASVDIYASSPATLPYFDPTSIGSTPRDHLDDEDPSGHGTGTASVAAAAKLPDGDPLLAGPGPAGMHGVAFESTVLAIRADDNDPGCNPDCDFNTAAIAAAVDYAVAHGAQIINLSLGGDPIPDPILRSALRNAVAAGVIIVASAGNDGALGPDWPANFGNDAFANDLAIAVGAVDETSTISAFSNLAGGSANFFVVAPGEGLKVAFPVDVAVAQAAAEGEVSNCAGGNTCYSTGAAGTSFAAPQVAGALALLLQGFPGLTPQEAVEILLTTSTDLGDADIDTVYGHGLINLQAAFAPIGASTISFGPGVVVPAELATVSASGATGDWIVASGLLDGAIMRDSYRRAFNISPAAAPAASATEGAFESAALAQRIEARRAAAPIGGGAVASAFFRAPDDAYLAHPNLANDRTLTPELSLKVRQGPLSFAMGRGFAAPAPLSVGDSATLTPSTQSGAIAALTSASDWASLGYDVGAWTVSVRSSGDEMRGVSAAALTRHFGPHSAGFEVGAAQEEDAALGGFVASRLGGDDGARTSFAALGWSGPLGAGWRGGARFEAAEAELSLPGHVEVNDDLLASAWTLSAERALLSGTTHLGVTLAQPLRAEAGEVSLLVPVDVTKVNASIYEERSASLTPSGREIDLETSLRFGLGARAEGRMAVRVSDDPGHIEGAEPETAAWFGVRWTR